MKKKPPRTNRVVINLNDSELNAMQRYCDRYNIRNRSRFIRETIIRSILQQLDNDSPTLFD